MSGKSGSGGSSEGVSTTSRSVAGTMDLMLGSGHTDGDSGTALSPTATAVTDGTLVSRSSSPTTSVVSGFKSPSNASSVTGGAGRSRDQSNLTPT